jgi:hypothetical protein
MRRKKRIRQKARRPPVCQLLHQVSQRTPRCFDYWGAPLFHLEHVDREIARFKLAIPIGPNAIHLIALDTDDGHQWPS